MKGAGMTQQTQFRMKFEEGSYNVYLSRSHGRDIPVDRQRIVLSSPRLSRVQPVFDALNSGLLMTIGRAARAEAEDRTAAQNGREGQ